MKKKIQTLFNNLCCSHCKSCFTEESFSIKREEDGLVVAHLECKHCDKKFGVALLGFSNIEFAEPLEVQEGPEAINYDDVIDAHRFIRDLDENWQQYIQKNAQ
jgi:hypothetical protein